MKTYFAESTEKILPATSTNENFADDHINNRKTTRDPLVRNMLAATFRGPVTLAISL